jgi:hypothetical protein
MAENLLLAEQDLTQSEGVLSSTRKWAGRLAIGGVLAWYTRESARYLSGNRLIRRVEEVIHHHEHEESPEDHEL